MEAEERTAGIISPEEKTAENTAPEEKTAGNASPEEGTEDRKPENNAGNKGSDNSGESSNNDNGSGENIGGSGKNSDGENSGGEKNTDDKNTDDKNTVKKSTKKSGAGKSGPGKKKGRKQPPPRKRKKRTLKQRVIALVIKLGIIVLVVWILLTYVGGVFICHTSDMYPSLRDGDLVITYRLGPYKSGDIVAYDYQGKIFFGRVVGEPGDEIFMDESGTFTVNGLMPYETIYYTTQVRDSDSMMFPYTVREGEYFVLADAREQGIDSRNFGPVTDMKGKVVLQIRRRGF